MSKGRGKKIAIKFDKPLLGDVTGNESAFTVTGMEKDPLFYGEPKLRQYAVEKVERYPLAELWRDGFDGSMDGVELGLNGLRLESAALQAFTAVGSHSFAVPEGVTAVDVLVVAGGGGGGSRQGGGGGAGGLIWETGISVAPEDEVAVVVGSGGAGGTNGGRGNNGGNSVFGLLTAIGGGGGGGRTTDNEGSDGGSGGGGAGPNTSPSPAINGGDGTSGQGNAGGGNTATTNNAGGGGGGAGGNGGTGDGLNEAAVGGNGGNGLNLSAIFGDEIGDDGWFAGGGGGGTFSAGSIPGTGGKGGGGNGAGGTGGNTPGQHGAPNTGGGGGGSEGASGAGGNGGSGIVIIKWGEDASEGTYAPPPINASTLPPAPRIRFDADTPEGTSVTVEYACTDDDETPPETWMSVDDEDLLTLDDAYLWLRYTLETEDTSKTPTLLAVWLEEAEAPPDTILLTMTEGGRFNNVEGDLTVAYNQALGNLAGVRPVESFEVSFTPTDLEPTPVSEHTITAKGEPVVNFIPVYYHEYPDYAAHTIAVTAGPINVAFIHVDDIPP